MTDTRPAPIGEANAAFDSGSFTGHVCLPEALPALAGVRHIHPGGYLVHHLFIGVVLCDPGSIPPGFWHE